MKASPPPLALVGKRDAVLAHPRRPPGHGCFRIRSTSTRSIEDCRLSLDRANKNALASASFLASGWFKMPEQPNRYVPAHVNPFQYSLPKFADRLKGSGSIKIVAIGSSSTAGEGDIVPYTYRLQTELRAKYPNRMIDVLNPGIGGQQAPAYFAASPADLTP